MSLDLFAHTARPDARLFFQRDEPGDPRLGEIVRLHPDDYANAAVVLLGCPQDEGVARNGGRTGAAEAPDAIRERLYRLVAPAGVNLFDLGNTHIHASLEQTHAIHQRLVRQIMADGKTLISLGGGNDLSYPDCSGLAQAVEKVLAFNVDAHLDVREHPVRNSGTPYRMLLEEGHIAANQFYEMAYQPFAVAESHLRYLREKGAAAYSLSQLRQNGLIQTFQDIVAQHADTAIFWGIDMDVVQISEAPGVSAPNPLGMTGDELCAIFTLAGQNPRTRILEITEVNPAYDIDQRTCRLAAVAIWHFLFEKFRSEHDNPKPQNTSAARDKTHL